MTITKTAETVLDIGIDDECPVCAENPPFNAITLAAMQEAQDIAAGKIPGKWYNSVEEARKDIGF